MELSFETIVVVTGKSLRSGVEGPVLRPGVPRFLRNTFGPEIRPDKRNEGSFFRQSFRKCAESDTVENSGAGSQAS